MLFPGEELSGKILLLFILGLAAILAIVINASDLSGDKKYKLFKTLRSSNMFFFIPASLYIIAIQIWGLAVTNYITVENSSWRLALLLGASFTLLLCVTRIRKHCNAGIEQTRKKSLNSSKYQQLFAQLRNSYVSIMVFTIFSFWLLFMFSGN